MQSTLHDETVVAMGVFAVMHAEHLAQEDALSMFALCSHCHNLLLPHIQQKYFFRIPPGRRITTLRPENIKVKRKEDIPTDYLIKVVYFNNTFYASIHDLPPSITHLKLGKNFNKPISSLPPSLTRITFGMNFNQQVDNLSPSITHLTFGTFFNQQVDNLPPSLTHLTFGANFNYPANNLPSTLIYLHFGAQFAQPIMRLPHSIKHLLITGDFNKDILVLPQKLTHLTLSYRFNRALPDLPKSLIFFKVGSYLDMRNVKALPGGLEVFHTAYLFHNLALPYSITHLVVEEDSSTISFSNLPRLTHLKTSRFNRAMDDLPSTLTHITFGCFFNQKVDLLPDSLLYIKFGSCFDKPVDKLPPSIIHLRFGTHFNQQVDYLPKSLKYLKFSCFFNRNVYHLPDSLETLEFGSYFNCPVDNLPSTLHTLKISGYQFKQRVNNLPPSILNLAINGQLQNLPPNLIHFTYTGSSALSNLPDSITHLTIGYDYRYPFPRLPASLKVLKFESRNKLLANTPIPDSLRIIYYGKHTIKFKRW